MRYWFYPAYVVVMGIIIFILDVWLGHLYVRYMVFLTGTIFMLGMLVGEGKEQRFAKRQKASAKSRSIVAPIAVEDARTASRPSRIEPLSRPSVWVGNGGGRSVPNTSQTSRGPALVEEGAGPVGEVER